MKKILLIFVCLNYQMLFGQTATAPSAGDGTSGTPYQIASLENLYWIAESSARWGYYYIQTANIDAAPTSGWSGGGWTPIGNGTTKFTGTYNGNGHTIDGLYINRAGTDHQGLFGYTNWATISNLGVTNVNINSYRRVGAIVGSHESGSTVINCFSTGSLTGSFIMGSLVGLSSSSTVSNCYSRGSISGSTTIGGLVGYNYTGSNISNCYSSVSVLGSHSTIGGLVGYNWNATVSNSFWDTETSGQSASAGGTGKTTADMKTQTTFSDAGWDFPTIWKLRSYKNDGYPYLRWQYPSPEAIAPSAGDGTSGSPYQIAILENLYWIAENSSRWGYYYIQKANIDASETSGWSSEGWIPIGNGTIQFTGNYNGDGHTIDGLYINRSGIEYQGLFGKTNTATITNLGVTNVNITGYYRAGGIVGSNYNNSTVTNCYSTGILAGNSMIGCLVGENSSSATVNTCYSTGSVTGTRMLGGLVGISQYSASVNNSYSRSSVTGSMYEVGGLVGLICYSATVSNSYSSGSVVSPSFDVGGLVGRNYSCPAVSNGFWDKQTSGRTTSAGGTGQTTDLMKTNSTFTNAGWDFTNIWEMIGTNYPRLKAIPEAALPVELTSFKANVIDNKIKLNWQTITEINNYGFEIEKREKSNVKSETWEKIAFVEGHGNSNSPKEYSFTERNVSSGKYSYRLKQIDTDGKFEYSNVVEVTIENTPSNFELLQNYPNPFNPVTKISWQSPVGSWQTLKVYDVLGNEVATLINEYKEAGSYEVEFDAINLSSGVYYCRLQAGSFVDMKKMILLK